MGTLNERGKFKGTDVRAGNAAAEAEVSLAPGEDTLERRAERPEGMAREVVEWSLLELAFLGRLAGVEAGQRDDFIFRFASVPGSTTEPEV